MPRRAIDHSVRYGLASSRLVAALVPGILVRSLGAALLGSVVLTILNLLIELLMPGFVTKSAPAV